jgi:cytochrome c biogenesis protein CcmG/thiol:disulfide interchange protein DsbE
MFRQYISARAPAGKALGRTPGGREPYPCAMTDATTPVHRRRSAARALWAAVAIASALTAACAGASAGPSPGGGAATALPRSASALPAVGLQQFRAMLAGLHGSPVLLNVWASWCGPCIEEAPALAALAKEYAGKVRFVGLDVEDTTSGARAFIAKYGWTFPSVSDPKGEVRNGLGLLAQPVTVLYDANGTQTFARSGPITEEQLRAALATVR